MARPESTGFSALFKQLGRRFLGRADPPGLDEAGPDQAVSADQTARQALAMMLDEAIAALRGLGLPSRPGFYRWNPHRREWVFLSSAMTPAERWAMVLEAPTGEGWRYATLSQLVRREMLDDEAVRQAAEVLEHGTACLAVADHAATGVGALEPAIKLAVAWADFQVARIVPPERREPLKLYFPADADHDSAAPPATPRKTAASRPAKAGKARATPATPGPRRTGKPGAGA